VAAAADPTVLRLAAFTQDPRGGNPAGVVLDAEGLSEAQMLAIAARVGYSETAFLTARAGDGRGEHDVRYFSPLAEVPFCGHATIASGVALARRDGPGEILLHTASGPVPVRTERDSGGLVTATLTSPAPAVDSVDGDVLARALAALRWSESELDGALPPRVAYAGARHLVLAAATRARLAELDYDFDALGALMAEQELITLQLVWREAELRFHARDPFPPGGVVEDPATGAAAAALGAYLRALGAITPPVTVVVHQGEDMGRPSTLRVQVASESERPGIAVSGSAVEL